MGILRWFVDDEYLPEFGTVVLRDVWQRDGEPLPEHENGLLGELATEALPGTVATAGDGWLHGSAGDPYQQVRLEVHDSVPPADLDGWDEVLESPFRSRSGVVGLGLLTGGTSGDTLTLGSRGLFRARVARKPADAGEEGDVWRIQFWPADAGQDLPRWLKRTSPPIRRPDPGWRAVLGYHITEVSWFLSCPELPRPEGWLDQPLPEDQPLLKESYRPHDLAAVCAQLGVEVPATRRAAIPLLRAAGLLTGDDSTGYTAVPDPPPATQILQLPPDDVTALDASAVRDRYWQIAADLTSIVAWADPACVDGLAERLLIPAAEVAPLITFAVSDHLITRDGDTLTALPRRPPPTPVPVALVPSRRAGPVTVPGGPPRGGFITDGGDVVVWRDGEPHALGRVAGEHLYSAYETVGGVAVFASSGAGTLVEWDGKVTALPVDLGIHVQRSADGRYLAGVEWHIGRRSWQQIHLVDLVTGAVHSLPRDDHNLSHVAGVHNATVYFGHRDAVGGGHSFRWTPGTEPEPLPDYQLQVDPLTGAALVLDADSRHVVSADGTRTALRLPAELAPGGDRVYTLRYTPPEFHLWTLGAAEPTEYPLPEGSATSTVTPGGPVWEDAHTLTLLLNNPHLGKGHQLGIVRLAMGSGVLEHFVLPENAGYRTLLVRPRLTEAAST